MCANTLSATEFVKPIESFLSQTFNEGIPSIYDKAMDAVYNSTNIGGGNLHRLSDNSHTLWGAWDKCKNASEYDSLTEEVLGYWTALGHDMSSTIGLPVFSMSVDNYHNLTDYLSNFGVSKSYVNDLLHFNTPEILSATIGVFALIFSWNSTDTEKFAQIAGSIGISTLLAANPIGGVISLVGLVRCYQMAKGGNCEIEALNGIIKGSVKTTLFIATSAIIGGPIWVGFVSAIVVYFLNE